MSKTSYLVLIVIWYFLSGCSSDDVSPTTVRVISSPSASEILNLGKAFAKTFEDPQVRRFIKDEALKKFDGDYDVLVQMIKSNRVVGDKTFADILNDNAKNIKLDELLNKLPLLTIYVPDLKTFSANSWNTQLETPVVAIATGSEDEGTIPLVNGNGEITVTSLNVAPEFPVIVLKINERVKLLGSGYHAKKSGRDDIFFSNEHFSFSFISEEAITQRHESETARFQPFGQYDIKVQNAYLKSNGCSNCYHRDYIYYSISPSEGLNQGLFDNSYQEAITSLAFTSVSAVQAVSNNWTEGLLEIHFSIVFLGGGASFDKVDKVIYVEPSKLWRTHRNTPIAATYMLPTPIKIFPWRMDQFGDRIKISVYEYDPGTTISRTITHTSTRGTNFLPSGGEANKIKVGPGLGVSSSTTYTGSVLVQSSQNANYLGEGIHNWYDRVIYLRANGGALPTDTGHTTEVNTGTVKFSIEPVK